jgi:hypothetical protein
VFLSVTRPEVSQPARSIFDLHRGPPKGAEGPCSRDFPRRPEDRRIPSRSRRPNPGVPPLRPSGSYRTIRRPPEPTPRDKGRRPHVTRTRSLDPHPRSEDRRFRARRASPETAEGRAVLARRSISSGPKTVGSAPRDATDDPAPIRRAGCPAWPLAAAGVASGRARLGSGGRPPGALLSHHIVKEKLQAGRPFRCQFRHLSSCPACAFQAPDLSQPKPLPILIVRSRSFPDHSNLVSV